MQGEEKMGRPKTLGANKGKTRGSTTTDGAVREWRTRKWTDAHTDTGYLEKGENWNWSEGGKRKGKDSKVVVKITKHKWQI